jgi:hypothetical protein
MPATSIAADKSPELLKLVGRAKDPRFTFLVLAHLIDEDALTRATASVRMRRSASMASRKEQYGHELEHVLRACAVVRLKWLNRRSQRARKTWDEFNDLLQRYPLPQASVRVPFW